MVCSGAHSSYVKRANPSLAHDEVLATDSPEHGACEITVKPCWQRECLHVWYSQLATTFHRFAPVIVTGTLQILPNPQVPGSQLVGDILKAAAKMARIKENMWWLHVHWPLSRSDCPY